MKAYHKTRCPLHDYRSKCTYLVTLMKAPGVEPFSFLFGTKEASYRDAGVRYSAIGRLVKDILRSLPERFPGIRINHYIVMPDHLHFIIEILEKDRYHLGDIISHFTRECSVANLKYERLFEPGYHDRILRRRGQLQNMREYLKENPRRCLIKESMPRYFKAPHILNLFGKDYIIFGNFFLLKDPELTAVRISSKFTENELNASLSKYEETIRGGGVLVSPFISPKEKKYRDLAIADGANLIYITRNPIGERFKPAGWLYNLWSEGRLLLISTFQSSQPEKITRSESLAMNTLAEKIATEDLGQLCLQPLYKTP
ncbi:MAG: hypothetical protein J1E97_07860 [Muribaculaceae bacterium]|nr:hypothetical protein [Muribaculaceae bacterium]